MSKYAKKILNGLVAYNIRPIKTFNRENMKSINKGLNYQTFGLF